VPDDNSFIDITASETINDTPIRWQTLIGTTEEVLDSTKDYFPLIRNGPGLKVSISESAEKYGIPAGKTAMATATKSMFFADALTLGGIATSGIKAWDSGIDIHNAWKDSDVPLNDKLLTTSREGLYGLESLSKIVNGTLDLLGICKNFSEKIGLKISPWFKVGGGYLQCATAFDSASKNEENTNRPIVNVLIFLSGAADVIGGICEFGVATAALSIPLGIVSSTALIAGEYYKAGHAFAAILTLAIGALVTTGVSLFMKAALKAAFKALMTVIKSAFNLTASPLAANPVTSIAGIAIIAIISTLIGQAISNLLNNIFAHGGFPDSNQPFIARESGPELVGKLNGQTAVVNNEQIVEAVSVGVYGAFQSALHNSKLNNPATARVFLDGKQIAVAG